jgi:hypothetical protein
MRFVRRDGRWAGRMAAVGLADGLGLSADVDPDALDTLFRCTGTVTLADALNEGSNGPAVETAVRSLLSCGLLEATDP